MTDAGRRLLADARALAPDLRARAREAEEAGTMPADLVDRMKAAGLFRMALPEALGGLALDPMTTIEVVEEVSRADGSAGWTTMIGNATAFLAWHDPAVAAALLGGRTDVSMTSMFGPLGTAVPTDDGGFVVNGRWPCNSGVPHADLIQVGVIVPEGDRAGWWFAVLRPEQIEIVPDTWDVAGLRGTGSYDITITDERIDAGQLSMPMEGAPRFDGALHRIPFWQLVVNMMGGFPLGVARRALDEIQALAPKKRRGSQPHSVAEDPVAQLDIGRAEAVLQAARAFLFDAADEVWSAACTGGPIPDASLQRYTLAGRHAMTAAVQVVDVAFHLGGAGAIYADQALQRCFRDIHAANQHLFFSDDQYRIYGELALAQR